MRAHGPAWSFRQPQKAGLFTQREVPIDGPNATVNAQGKVARPIRDIQLLEKTDVLLGVNTKSFPEGNDGRGTDSKLPPGRIASPFYPNNSLTPTPRHVRVWRRLLYCWAGHDLIRDRLASGALALVCRHCLTAYPIDWGTAWPNPPRRQ